MRLLNVRTRRLEEFVGDAIPQYDILSHTWGPNEVTFKDIELEGYKSGSVKIEGCCMQALRHGRNYVWIDTCCIDKSSSAELSEAINSMWSWYEKAAVCYAYLSDVPFGDEIRLEDSFFRRSRWFTRGWTLQELLAPDRVLFYGSSWNFLGQKSSATIDRHFVNVLSDITGIPSTYLRTGDNGWPIESASIAQRMSWAAGRKTTRVEDVAYSLLGIFSVNMTMLYGEGNRAFTRLQEEIMKSSPDESIFAWGTGGSLQDAAQFDRALLASSPANFEGCGNFVPFTTRGIISSHFVLTNQGLHIEMSIFESGSTAIGRLNCWPPRAGPPKCVAVPLIGSLDDDNFFTIARGCPLALVSSFLFTESSRAHIYLRRGFDHKRNIFECDFEIRCSIFDREVPYGELNLMITEFYPPAWRGLISGDYTEKVKPELKWQQILFRVHLTGLSDFAVQLDCSYEPMMVVPLLTEIRYRAAFIEKELALAEVLMIESEEGAEKMLNWQESLDFGNAELKFDWHKRNARGTWILDINITAKQGASGSVSP
jgi:hypothetical protein